MASRRLEWSQPPRCTSSSGGGGGTPMAPRRSAVHKPLATVRGPRRRLPFILASSATSISKRSPSKSMSPVTNARAIPSSSGDQTSRAKEAASLGPACPSLLEGQRRCRPRTGHERGGSRQINARAAGTWRAQQFWRRGGRGGPSSRPRPPQGGSAARRNEVSLAAPSWRRPRPPVPKGTPTTSWSLG